MRAILEGARAITVSAINAEDRIDSGGIWAKKTFDVVPHELHNEINASLFETEIALMDQAIAMVKNGAERHPHPDEKATYYPHRTPQDSELDPSLTSAEKFDKIKISDPDRYPAFFEMHGALFSVSLRKMQSDE